MSAIADRQLPNSLEAEMGLLGSMFLSPREVTGEVLHVIGADVDHFYQHAHKVIYERVRAMYDAGDAIDPVLLTQRLKDAGKLDDVGGPIYVTNLFTSVPTAGNWAYYLKVVREKYLLRRLIDVGTQVVSEAYNPDASAEAILATFSEQLTRGIDTGHEFTTHKQALASGFDLLEKIYRAEDGLLGVSTGYRRMDKYTRGLKEGEFWILGGPPSQGKTALAMNIMLHVAAAGHPVGMLSMEQSTKAIALRSVASGSRVEIYKFPYSADTFPKLSNEHARQAALPIFYDDRSGLTVSRARASIRRMAHRHKIKVAVVDYLQLMDAEEAKQGATEAMTAVSKGLKNLAKELGITVLALSQLNRSSRTQDRRPQLHDLRSSGQLEQDADIAMLLAGEAKESDFEKWPVETRPQASDMTNMVIVDIAKNRDGKTGPLPFQWAKECFRFEEYRKEPQREPRETRDYVQ